MMAHTCAEQNPKIYTSNAKKRNITHLSVRWWGGNCKWNACGWRFWPSCASGIVGNSSLLVVMLPDYIWLWYSYMWLKSSMYCSRGEQLYIDQLCVGLEDDNAMMAASELCEVVNKVFPNGSFSSLLASKKWNRFFSQSRKIIESRFKVSHLLSFMVTVERNFLPSAIEIFWCQRTIKAFLAQQQLHQSLKVNSFRWYHILPTQRN